MDSPNTEAKIVKVPDVYKGTGALRYALVMMTVDKLGPLTAEEELWLLPFLNDFITSTPDGVQDPEGVIAVALSERIAETLGGRNGYL